MVVAIDEKFMDQTLRILSGEALAAEQDILAQNKIASEYVYIPDTVTHEDGSVETYHIAMDKNAKPEEIDAAKTEMQVRRKAARAEAAQPDPPPAHNHGPQFADTINSRFPIDTLDDIQKSTVDFAEAMLAGEYGSEQREDILKRLGQARKDLQASDPPPTGQPPEGAKPETKSVAESFAEALDAAVDNALLGAVDSVYYAFVRTFAGSYNWDAPNNGRDADQLTREEFNELADLLAAAFKDIYDKLADDADGARAAALRANDFANKALLGIMNDTLTDEQISVATKAGKRHSKHDENRMEIMHGALTGLGYQGCLPVEDESASEEAAENASKALKELGLSDEQVKSCLTALSGFRIVRLKTNPTETSVTGSPSTDGETSSNTGDDAQTRIKAIEAELATVKAKAQSSESELSRVKEEQQARDSEVARLEEALQTQKSQLDKVQKEPAGDPLDRTPEKVPNEETKKKEVSGARRSYRQFTRELSH